MLSKRLGLIKPVILALSLIVLVFFIASSLFRLEKEIDEFSMLTKDERYWNSTRIEVELLRLVNEINSYAVGADPAQRDEISFRMEILWSRINIVSKGATRELIEQLDKDILTEVDRLQTILIKLEDDLENLTPDQARQYNERMQSFIPRFMHSSRTIASAISATESQFALKVQENYRWVVFLLISILIIATIFTFINYLELRRNQQLALKAEAASRSKSDFLSNMSHEIRTPLNGILGSVELLRLEEELQQTSSAASLLDDITASGKALLNLINNILDLSRLQQKKMPIEHKSLDLVACAQSARSVINADLTRKQLHFHLDSDPNLPREVLSDPLRLQQIMINLLGNAVKFTESGSIALRIRGELSEASKQTDSSGLITRQVLIEIEDSGIGIPPDVQKRLFDPFTQADSSTTRHYGGSGLGLSLCREIVEAMQGEIGVRSQPGKGSVFWFRIPVKVDPEQIVQHQNKPLGVQPETSEGEPLILIVEDNQVNAKLAIAILKKLGYNTEHAENGRIALEMCQKRQYGLILMDCQMPVMDGITCCRILRKDDSPNKTTPVVALTANVMEVDRQRCLQAGMQEFLTKPIDTHLLKKALENWYRHRL